MAIKAVKMVRHPWNMAYNSFQGLFQELNAKNLLSVFQLSKNKRAMLRSLGGSQIKKYIKNGGGQSQSFKNNNKQEFSSTQYWGKISQGNYLCKNYQNLMGDFENISSKGPF